MVQVLVVHGSTRGGTAGLGTMIAEAFCRRDVQADVGNASEVDDLSAYDVVLVGGALYNGRWHRDALDFVADHGSTLRRRRVWLFSSGPLDGSARSGALAPVPGVQRVARDLDVMGHMTFGGRLAVEDVRAFDRWRSRRKVGDYRDPGQVEEWVTRVLSRLAELPQPRSPEPPGGLGVGSLFDDG